MRGALDGGFLRLGLAVALLNLAACSSDESATTTASVDPATLAADAFVWGFPLVVTERTLENLGTLIGVNNLFNQSAITTSTIRVIVAPNQDTLYSVAVLDLRSEPVVLNVPDVMDRYWTYQFLDAWTESFHYIGTRATGGRGGTFVITPPDWNGTLPAGAEEIRSPTPQLFLLGRYHVNSADDVPNIVALVRTLVPLHQVTGEPAPPAPPPLGQAPGPAQQVGSDGARFFDELGDALAANGAASDFDRNQLERFGVIGIAPGAHPTESADAERLAVLESGVSAGLNRITNQAALRQPVNGWSTSLDIGQYGDNVLLRAVVARIAWGANVPEEAVYPISRQDASGAPYDGTKRYTLHFDAGKTPPVTAPLGFWSVTVYGTDMFFVKNSLERYAIGGSSTGLAFNTDGSLDLYLQNDTPLGYETNWLPIPAAPFVLVMRMYLPAPEVLAGNYVVPAVQVAP